MYYQSGIMYLISPEVEQHWTPGHLKRDISDISQQFIVARPRHPKHSAFTLIVPQE